MRENIFWLVVGGLFLTLLSGCAGAMPAESWTDFKKRTEFKDNYPESVQETQVSKKSEGIQVKKTYIPSKGIKGSVSINGIGAGVEVHEKSNYRQDKTVIKLFGGSEGPDFNDGKRDKKRDARRLKDEQEYQLAIDLAEEHAANGYMSFVGVPGKYYEKYEEVYESFVKYDDRESFNDYRRSEYERGVEDFRAKNPEYGNFAQLTEQLEAKARADARTLRYQLPAGLTPELERVYYEVFVSESKSLIKEKAQRDAKAEIFDPPYDMSDFVDYYEMVYKKENGRLHRKYDRRQW